MGKVFNMVFLALGLMVLMQSFGLVTGLNPLLARFGLGVDNLDLTNSDFYQQVQLLLAGAFVGGIVIGFFTKSQTENMIINTLTSGFLLVVLVSIFSTLLLHAFNSNYPDFIRFIVLIILGPITVGCLMAIVEFFRGTD